jgi:hypothetical protein
VFYLTWKDAGIVFVGSLRNSGVHGVHQNMDGHFYQEMASGVPRYVSGCLEVMQGLRWNFTKVLGYKNLGWGYNKTGFHCDSRFYSDFCGFNEI